MSDDPFESGFPDPDDPSQSGFEWNGDDLDAGLDRLGGLGGLEPDEFGDDDLYDAHDASHAGALDDAHDDTHDDTHDDAHVEAIGGSLDDLHDPAHDPVDDPTLDPVDEIAAHEQVGSAGELADDATLDELFAGLDVESASSWHIAGELTGSDLLAIGELDTGAAPSELDPIRLDVTDPIAESIAQLEPQPGYIDPATLGPGES